MVASRLLYVVLLVLVAMLLAACGASSSGDERGGAAAIRVDGHLAYAVQRNGEWSVVTESLDDGTKRVHPLGVTVVNDRVSFSRTARFAAFSGVRDGRTDIYVLDLERGTVRPLGLSTRVPESLGRLVWSPDERMLASVDERAQLDEIMQKLYDPKTHKPTCAPQRPTDFMIHVIEVGSGELRTLPALPPTAAPLERNPTWIEQMAWAPDSQRLLYAVWQGSECEAEGMQLRQAQLSAVRVSGGAPDPVTAFSWPGTVSWSPDGMRVAVAGWYSAPGDGGNIDVGSGSNEGLPGLYIDVAWTRLGIYALRLDEDSSQVALVLADPERGSERVLAALTEDEWPTASIAAPIDGRCVELYTDRKSEREDAVRQRVYSSNGTLLLDRNERAWITCRVQQTNG